MGCWTAATNTQLLKSRLQSGHTLPCTTCSPWILNCTEVGSKPATRCTLDNHYGCQHSTMPPSSLGRFSISSGNFGRIPDQAFWFHYVCFCLSASDCSWPLLCHDLITPSMLCLFCSAVASQNMKLHTGGMTADDRQLGNALRGYM